MQWLGGSNIALLYPTHSLQTALQTVYMLYLFTVSQTGLWATCAISGPWQL